jgi:Tol biopolymer transport system component
LRSRDAFDAKLIAGTDSNSSQPFFSPDGQFIGYVSQSDQKLRKVSANGGTPVVICDTSGRVSGASWDSEDMIVYSDAASGGIFRISAKGGTPELLIKSDPVKMSEEGIPIYQQMLPGGKDLLFTLIFAFNDVDTKIVVQSLESGKQEV